MLLRIRSPTGQFRLNLQESATFTSLISEISKFLKTEREFKLNLDFKENEILSSKLKYFTFYNY